MGAIAFTCPRCFHAVEARPGARFCRRCGLADAPAAAAADGSPLDVTAGGRAYRVLDRFAVGSLCTLYRCRFLDGGGGEVEGVFKVARDPRANGLVANEADVLRRLADADPAGRFAPFLPAVEASVTLGGEPGEPGEPPRRANVLRAYPAIRSPADELYSLDEVRAAYPAGLDPRDVAWVWRRLLSVLGFAHASGIVHAAVLPMHVLIEPRDHKLVLVDWCCAAATSGTPPTILTGGYLPWYRRDGGHRRPPTAALDVAFAARCMIELLGGDPLRAVCPPAVDPALQRYFSRCIGGGGAGAGILSNGAWKLLEDFDHLIGALWGPRTFRVLTLPPKAAATAAAN